MEKYSLKNKKENSIEKDIKILEKFIDVWKNQNEAIDRILSDYKRLLKENEQYRTEVNSLEKENKNLKAVRKWYFENTVSKICTPEMLNKILRNDYISKQKVKDKIEEIQKEYNKLDEQINEYIKDANKDLSKYYENKEKVAEMQMLSYFIDNLRELIEEKEK